MEFWLRTAAVFFVALLCSFSARASAMDSFSWGCTLAQRFTAVETAAIGHDRSDKADTYRSDRLNQRLRWTSCSLFDVAGVRCRRRRPDIQAGPCAQPNVCVGTIPQSDACCPGNKPRSGCRGCDRRLDCPPAGSGWVFSSLTNQRIQSCETSKGTGIRTPRTRIPARDLHRPSRQPALRI